MMDVGIENPVSIEIQTVSIEIQTYKKETEERRVLAQNRYGKHSKNSYYSSLVPNSSLTSSFPQILRSSALKC